MAHRVRDGGDRRPRRCRPQTGERRQGATPTAGASARPQRHGGGVRRARRGRRGREARLRRPRRRLRVVLRRRRHPRPRGGDRPRRLRVPGTVLALPPLHDWPHRREDVLLGPGESHLPLGRPRGRLRQGEGGDDGRPGDRREAARTRWRAGRLSRLRVVRIPARPRRRRVRQTGVRGVCRRRPPLWRLQGGGRQVDAGVP